MPKKTHNQLIGEHHGKREDKFQSKQLKIGIKEKNSPGVLAEAVSDTIEVSPGEVGRPIFVPETKFRLNRKQTSVGAIFLLTALLTSLSPTVAAEFASMKPSGRKSSSTPKSNKGTPAGAKTPPPTEVPKTNVKSKQASREKLISVETPAYPEAGSASTPSHTSYGFVAQKVKGSHSAFSPTKRGNEEDTSPPHSIHPTAAELTSKLRARIKFTEDYDVSALGGKTKVEVVEDLLGCIGELITAMPEQACRLETLLKAEDFNILLGERFFNSFNSDTRISIFARYDTKTNTLNIIRPTDDRENLKKFIVHEMHHAFIVYQNRHEIKIGSTDSGFITLDPGFLTLPYKFSVTDSPESEKFLRHILEETEKFLRHISDGASRVDNLLRIANIHTSGGRLSPSDRSQLRIYRKISSTFTFVGEVATNIKELDQDYVNQLIASGVLTPSLEMVKLITVIMNEGKPYELHLYLRKIEKIGGKYMGSYYVTPIPDPLREILLLVQYQLKICRMIYRPDETQAMTAKYPSELDAHLYELLHPYPVLYQALFPELVQHHEKRYSPSYQDCRANLVNRFFSPPMVAVPAGATPSAQHEEEAAFAR